MCGHVRLLESDLLRSPLLRLVSRMRKSTGANSAGQRPYALPFVCLLIHLCSYWVSHQAMNGLGKGCPNGHATRRSSVMAIDEYEQHLRAMCTNHSTSASQCRSSVAGKHMTACMRLADTFVSPKQRKSNANHSQRTRKKLAVMHQWICAIHVFTHWVPDSRDPSMCEFPRISLRCPNYEARLT